MAFYSIMESETPDEIALATLQAPGHSALLNQDDPKSIRPLPKSPNGITVQLMRKLVDLLPPAIHRFLLFQTALE